jgi:hypothetical protein
VTNKLSTLLVVLILTVGPFSSVNAQTLEAFASFPADTFAAGPTSGHRAGQFALKLDEGKKR